MAAPVSKRTTRSHPAKNNRRRRSVTLDSADNNKEELLELRFKVEKSEPILKTIYQKVKNK